MSAALALLSSLMWGSADFLGGTVSRRLPVLAVVGVSQACGLLAVLAVAVLGGELSQPLRYLPWAVAAGLSGLLGLCCFYTALAVGTMGVVSPIAALGVVVPVVVGLARGEHPTGLQLAGVVLAVAGVVLASGPELSGKAGARPVLLAAIAAIGFGLALTFLAEGSRTSAIMTLVGMRVASVTLAGAVAARVRSVGGVRRADLPVLALVGIGDAGANLTFGLASTRGLVSVVAVLGSLYPVATLLMARGFHGERLGPAQVAGVVGALGGIALIAAGGGAG